MKRSERLLAGADAFSRILEIGPSYSPIASRASGWNTHVVDHAPRSELRHKYRDAKVDLDAIEEVDTIWTTGALHDAIPATLHGSFDRLIASHVIEHFVDPIGFLKSAAILLKPDGMVSLAVPDKRYCFDYYKPLTKTGDWLEAHTDGRTRHPLRAAWNDKAYSVLSDGRLGWGQEPIGSLTFCDAFDAASRVHADYGKGQDYVDFHAWHFTPASFDLLLLELRALGLIDWYAAELDGPSGLEFFATLQRQPAREESLATLQERRMCLLRQQMTELQRQLDAAGEQTALQLAEQRLSEALSALAAVSAERDTAVSQRDATVSQRDALSVERDALGVERDALIAERGIILGSTSWRITAPLRWMATRLTSRGHGGK